MESSPLTWVLLCLGSAISAFGIWQLLGLGRNARAWLEMTAGRPPDGALKPVYNNVFLIPSLGFLVFGFGLFPLVSQYTAVAGILGVAMLLAGVVFVCWGLMQFPFPLALIPRWARDVVRRRKEAARGKRR